MTSPAFAIAGRHVGPDHPPYVIAEGGVNHNGDVDLALRLIDAAADAMADAVKFQTFQPALLATANAERATYQRSGSAAVDSQRSMLEELTLPAEAWGELARHARRRGITFLSSPFDLPSLALLTAVGVPAFKIGSGDLTNALLLRAVGRTGAPVVLSTGMGTLRDVEAAVGELRAAGATAIALLHCTSIYPAPIGEANLRAITTLRRQFNLQVGFSDHTLGRTAAAAAIGCGAVMVEKHLTLDRGLPGPDHAASLEAGEFAELVREVRAAWDAMGDGEKRPRPGEREIMRVARRSLVAARPLPAGHVLEAADLDAKRPGTGISPMDVDEVIGRRLARAVEEDQLIRPGDMVAVTEAASRSPAR